jgi:hypothetical protein
MDICQRQREVRACDRDYARRQLQMHALRDTSGVCHMDSRVPCKGAWRCGFECKIECCVNYTRASQKVLKANCVPTSCVYCTRHKAGNCVFVCVRRCSSKGLL